MNTTEENIAASIRRVARIRAVQCGMEIPDPETAAQDAREGNADDRHVVAMIEGRKIREDRERLAHGGKALAHASENDGGICFLNEAQTEMLAISCAFPNDFRAA